jgi:hypothetical protein
MINKIEDALARLNGVTIILWFTGCLTKALTTSWMWEPERVAQTVFDMTIVLLMPFIFLIGIAMHMIAESYDGK